MSHGRTRATSREKVKYESPLKYSKSSERKSENPTVKLATKKETTKKDSRSRQPTRNKPLASTNSGSSRPADPKKRNDSVALVKDKINVKHSSDTRKDESKKVTNYSGSEKTPIRRNKDSTAVRVKVAKNRPPLLETDSAPVKKLQVQKPVLNNLALAVATHKEVNGTTTAPTEVLEESEDYEDDFEDYESDFEDSETSDDTISADVQIVTVDEVPSSHAVHAVEELPIEKQVEIEEPIYQTVNASRQYIDFTTSAKKEAEVKSKSKVVTRGSELQELITLDKQRFILFEMPPAKYEVYIEAYGKSNHKQVYTQTSLTEEIALETEKIETIDKWTQNPPHDLLGVGGDCSENTKQALMKSDPIRIDNFIRNSSRLLLDLLNEEVADLTRRQLSRDTALSTSQGYFQVKLPLPASTISKVEVPSSGSYVLIICVSNEVPERELNNRNTICIWNVMNPTIPDHILVCSSEPLCGCFGMENDRLVFSGGADGSISLWDLHDDNSIRQTDRQVRIATYSTAVITGEKGHGSRIVAVRSVPAERGSCRLFSLEETGILNTWVVVRSIYTDLSGSEVDLGLSPGGRWKLVKSSTVLLDTLFSLPQGTLNCNDFQMHLRSLFVATNSSSILHCTNSGSKGTPVIRYGLKLKFPVEVTCLAFSPHEVPYFLAGCSDGSVRLHSTEVDQPISIFQSDNPTSIVRVWWTYGRPSIFIVLDLDSRLSVWDIAKDTLRPIITDWFSHNTVVDFCLFGDSESVSSSTTLANTINLIVIAYKKGDFEVHQLREDIFSVSDTEYDILLDLMLNKL